MAANVRCIAMAALGMLAVAGCTPAQAPQGAPAAEPSQSFSRDMSSADRASCTAAGGTVERRGRIGAELCVRPFADASKQCTDSAQCQGKCVGTAEQVSSTAPVTGQCQADDRMFGCHSEIRQGKAVNAVCID
jgi:putative hemolysin